ncbi:BgTH12-00058 [Blumeria graminis f. sp. triticale]|nr:BgTH12-00058 [Blumeria graminis f. sp. triticale]
MELLYCILEVLRKMTWSLPATADVNRNKLQKKRRDRQIKKIYSREMLNVVRKSSMALCLPGHDALARVTLASPDPQFARLLHHRTSDLSDTSSVSRYSMDFMQQQTFRRTRPKTPILRVGQLEDLAHQADSHACQLAEDYQALLPLSSSTDPNRNKCQPARRLRKVKSQTSLRDLSRNQAEAQAMIAAAAAAIDSDGDLDTLVGSEPASPDTKQHKNFSPPTPLKKSSCASMQTMHDDTDIGLKICVDLLTNELASILFRHHPIEESDRASELQILLMIEAYETIQKQIHEKSMGPNVTAGHIRELEQLLDHWLDVLYNLYGRSQDTNVTGAENEIGG